MDWWHAFLGVAVGVVTVVVLGLFSGRIFRRSPRARRAGYGLLVEVAIGQPPEVAAQVRDRLATVGVRGTLAPCGRVQIDARGEVAPPGVSVLVFPEDLAAATAVLAAVSGQRPEATQPH